MGLFTYDMDGKLLWKKDLGSYRTAFNWGTASSPVLHGDRLFIVDDNEEHSFVVALDAKTGKEIWKVKRDEKSNWATPYIWENDLRTELVTCGKKKVRSYSLDGKLLWELDGMSSIVIPTPFSAARASLRHIRLRDERAQADLCDQARRPKGTSRSRAKRRPTSSSPGSKPKGGPYNVSPIVYGKDLYVLYDRGFLSAFDACTGKPLYQPPMVRLGASEHYTASPWAYNGKIFCLSEEGQTVVIPTGGQKPEIVRTERSRRAVHGNPGDRPRQPLHPHRVAALPHREEAVSDRASNEPPALCRRSSARIFRHWPSVHSGERKRDRSDIDEVGGLDSGSGSLGTASDLALREFSWATYGPISRFESEPFGDLFLPLGTAKRTAPLHALA